MSLIALSAFTMSFMGHGADASPEPRLLRNPSIHGDTVVFTYAGDLWVAKTAPGAPARRLTSHPGLESRAKISPDGTTVAFTGTYEGNPDVYVMPIDGGEPKRLTYEPQVDAVLGWTPEGKIAYSSTFGSSTNRNQRMWLVDPKGGLPKSTPIVEVNEISFLPDGKTMAYNRFTSNKYNWRRYRGGVQGRISLYNFEKNTYSELPAGREQNYYPMAVANSIYYTSDKKLGTQNLYRYDLGSKKETQLTQYSDADIRYPSTDGEGIVFERDGYLYRFDVKSGKAERLTPSIKAENLAARPSLRQLGGQITSLSLSPSGNRVAIEARGEIFTVPAKAGETRNLTNSQNSRERYPTWSPDGKTIVYISDATGETQLYSIPQAGGKAEQLTTDLPVNVTGINWSPDGKSLSLNTRAGALLLLDMTTKKWKQIVKGNDRNISHDWSPDSKWIGYIVPSKNGLGQTHLYEVATGKDTQITEGYYNDQDVAFDTNGKYLYLMSERTYDQNANSEGGFDLYARNGTRVYVLPLLKSTPNPFAPGNDEEPEPAAKPEKPAAKPADGPKGTAIDLDGLGDRAVPLPWTAGSYFGLIGMNNGVIVVSPTGLNQFDFASKQSQPIWAGPPVAASLNASKTKLAYYSGGQMGIVDIRPGLQPGQGRVDLSDVSTVVDPRAEWKQIFWEAWRYERDLYYDPGMRGLDWAGIGKRYEGYLPFVNHRLDLNEILGLMIGELGTGHSYVTGGDFGNMGTPTNTGLLGADYVADGAGVKFKKIYRGAQFDETRRGPLGDPGISVAEGEYLLAIDGRPVGPETNPSALLVNKAGKYVTLTVNSEPSLEGSRKIRVQPLADESNLRYVEMIEARRKRVSELSGGKIGYLHVPNTSQAGANEFTRGFLGQWDKDALIVDERDNGGGNIPTFFVERLKRRSLTKFQPRGADDQWDSQFVDGPIAMLINENAGSGGDMLPYLFKRRGVGLLIGRRTWGGLVGIAGFSQFVDGGGVSAPEFSIYDPETNQIIAENTGVDPDIDIDNRPDLVALGQDPQLEKAVEHLLAEIKKYPAKKVRTTVPVVGPNGRIKP